LFSYHVINFCNRDAVCLLCSRNIFKTIFEVNLRYKRFKI
jgi:hypothetical protein